MGGDSERGRETPSQTEMRTEYNRYLLSQGLTCFPQKKYIEALSPQHLLPVTLFGNRVTENTIS